MPVSIGPTVRRRRLGSELRRLREAHSFKLEEAADRLGLAESIGAIPIDDREADPVEAELVGHSRVTGIVAYGTQPPTSLPATEA